MGKFVISKAKNGEYTFNLKAGNGEVILSASETYASLDSCKAGEFRFRLKARNGENIGRGEGYKAKASALNGIASIGKNAPEADVLVEEE